MTDITESAINAVAHLARTGDRAHILPVENDRTILVAPVDKTITDITDKIRADAERPRHRSGTVVLQEMNSFISFVRRMAVRPQTVLFGDTEKNRIEAIFDHHDPIAVPSPESSDGTTAGDEWNVDDPFPDWGRYRASYAFPLSKTWQAWRGANLKAQTQEQLAIFLEENLVDVLPASEMDQDPQIKQAVDQLGLKVADPLRLLELSRNFRIVTNETASEALALSSGETELHYRSEQRGVDNAGTKIVVPTAFLVALPVFEGGAMYRLLVRLRTRRIDGAHSFIFDIYRLERTQEKAFADECRDIAVRADVPLFFGVPPTPAAP